jgi:hypothetical protein
MDEENGDELEVAEGVVVDGLVSPDAEQGEADSAGDEES